MLHLANTARCSLMFALLMVIHSVANSEEFAIQSELRGSLTSLSVSATLPAIVITAHNPSPNSCEASPPAVSNTSDPDLQAINRRSTERSNPISRLRWIRVVINRQSVLMRSSAIMSNQILSLNSELEEFECLQARINETRGKPGGQVISALGWNSVKSLPDGTRGTFNGRIIDLPIHWPVSHRAIGTADRSTKSFVERIRTRDVAIAELSGASAI